MFSAEQRDAMEALDIENGLYLKDIKDRSVAKHGITIKKQIRPTTAKEKNTQATTSGPQLSALSESC